MKRFYKILRALIVITIAIAVTIPATVYVGLSLPPVQRHLSTTAEKELSNLLGGDVTIGSLTIAPFNRAMLRDVSVTLDHGRDSVMTVERIGAGINLYELIMNREVIINYVELIGLDLAVHRDSVGSPLNIQPIIDKLSPKNQNKPKSHFNLAINTVILRDSRLSYDIDSIMAPEPGRFSPAHIHVSDFSADLRLPAIGNDRQIIEIKRFKVKESSGLEITNLMGNIAVTPDSLSWHGINVNMPGSLISLKDCSLHNPNHISLDSLLLTTPLNTGITTGSHITPADLAPLAPQLKNLTDGIMIELSIKGTINNRSDIKFTARSQRRDTNIKCNAGIFMPFDSLHRAIKDLKLSARVSSPVINQIFELKSQQQYIVNAAEYIDLDLDASASNSTAVATATVATASGNIEIAANISALDSRAPRYDLDLNIVQLEAGKLLQRQELDIVSLNASASGRFINRRPNGEAELNIDRLDWQGHRFGDITATLSTNAKEYDLKIKSYDPAARFDLKADGTFDRNVKSLNLASQFDLIDIGELFPDNKFRDCTLRFRTHADLNGNTIDDISGRINIHDIQLDRPDGNNVALNGILIAATTEPDGKRIIDLQSDIISGEVCGDIYFSTIAGQIKELALESLPALDTQPANRKRTADNNFTYSLTLHDTELWAEPLRFPVSNLGESDIHGIVNYPSGSMSLNLNAPYLRQGNKLIEQTQLQATVDGSSKRSKIYFTSHFPTKHGPLAIDFNTDLSQNRIGSNITWSIDRAARYDGNISASAQLDRLQSGTHALITLNPGELTFNDSTWTVNRATIDVAPGLVVINGINAHRSGQYVKIDGKASHLPDDEIRIDLLGVNLDYIFESLGIDKVMLGGDATGRFYASNLFSSEPHLNTDGLSVKAISYNKVVLGDALVRSRWDSEQRAITLDAVVDQDNGLKTFIDGAIFPLNDSIDITFDAHDVDVAFMHPYMSAFATEVSGRASGVARLWGNFKYIDMEGDIAGDNLKIKIGFTNTTYTTSDTVKLRLGEITLNDITISDIYGNTAQLNGKVWHKYFKEPVFDFKVTNAQNLLVYDETSRQNPDWYGRIFGNGFANISGKPGVVDITVDMLTAPGSTFTFVLNDMEVASDYTFITFRDRDVLAMGDREKLVDDTPSTVRRLREMLTRREEESSSAYNINLKIDINTNAQINLIMDPVGGDRIRSWGLGSLRMQYGSADNELHMYGSYTLERGNYNYTLQDIIIKDFTIKEGSTITFTGDPFSAVLDIKAAYALTANLTDLDESFLQDKDLNRTSVPVNAILKARGALQQPEISFDLEFPSLTQDTYRKVRSIVSTDDMMNRQFFYLIAFNRFYTPEYMAAATRGNELVSVASSTISSQLSNILGNLSENWNIAPTFRSDRGDFSDVEVDVALSSSLLNNRLLFNGNFGYRDKSLNNTQFVGDFDIEYLLNRAGTLRLKAYNRYNDMNYYVRTAETTQGVGVSFRRNFDSLTDLIRSQARRERRAAADTTATQIPKDSIR